MGKLVIFHLTIVKENYGKINKSVCEDILKQINIKNGEIVFAGEDYDDEKIEEDLSLE